MVVCLLISLSVGMMICLPSPVISEATEIALGNLRLLDFNGNTFDLKNKIRITKKICCNLPNCLEV